MSGFRVTPEKATISVVPSRVRQVLINLIDNGVKYTPAGGRVTVTATCSTDGAAVESVRIEVTDTGMGIPARDLPHVFDKFYRVRTKATSEIAGTGLGLAITKSIVEAYGGGSGWRASKAPAPRSPSCCRSSSADAHPAHPR